jgi:imidazolonepropionase-like amidohydrolase
MAWTFSGTLLDGAGTDHVSAGAGEPRELPGRYALAGLVDAHAHPTVADEDYGAARLDEYAAAGVTVIRDALPYAAARGVRVLAGTDISGTIAREIALLAAHGLPAGQAIAAAGSHARDFLGIHPEGDIVTYHEDPREDPAVLGRPAAVVVRGTRVR